MTKKTNPAREVKEYWEITVTLDNGGTLCRNVPVIVDGIGDYSTVEAFIDGVNRKGYYYSRTPSHFNYLPPHRIIGIQGVLKRNE